MREIKSKNGECNVWRIVTKNNQESEGVVVTMQLAS